MAARRKNNSQLGLAIGMLFLAAITGVGCRQYVEVSGTEEPPRGAARSSSDTSAPRRAVLAPAYSENHAAVTSSDTSPGPTTLAPIEWAAPKVTPERLRKSVKEAVHYLARSIDDEGRFAYLANTDPTVKIPAEYNIVRHAGTMYGMGMYLQRYDPSDKLVKDALVRAANFLRQQMVAVPGHEELTPVWSYPEVTGGTYAPQAHVGSSALGLVSLATLETVAPGTTPKEDLQGLANFLLFMQQPDGGYAMALERDGKKIVSDNPRFYPGEAALALGLLYEIDPNPKWIDSINKTLTWMAERKDADDNPVFDHWFPLATAQVWPFLSAAQRAELKGKLIPATVLLCEDFSTPTKTNLKSKSLAGCLTGDGLTCPTATRCEGMMGALFYLPESNVELRSKIRSTVEESLLFLIGSQVAEGKYAGGIPFAAIRYPETESGPNRRFNARAGEIRIDYVHHAISGMMLYDDLFLTSPPRLPSLKHGQAAE